jgi:hypothetical protein
MRRAEVEAELEHVPFKPFRLHLVSGKALDVQHSDEGWMLKNSILVTRRRKSGNHSYDVVSLGNIERIERIGGF